MTEELTNCGQDVAKGKALLYSFLSAILPVLLTFAGNIMIFPFLLRRVSFGTSIWIQMLFEIALCCVFLAVFVRKLTEPKPFWLRLSPIMALLILFLIASMFLETSSTKLFSHSSVQLPHLFFLVYLLASSLTMYWYLWPFLLVVPPCTCLMIRNPKIAKYVLTIESIVLAGLLVGASVVLIYRGG